ncbi:MAG TPA: MFS transporter [Terriglobales bacterium]|jgi:MFS family permease
MDPSTHSGREIADEIDLEARISPPTATPESSLPGPQTGTPLAGLESSEERIHGRAPTIIRALQHPDYRNFWIGNFLSNIGTWMQNVAEGWLVLQLSNSPFWLGMVGFAATFPVTVFTIFGGVVADRVNKKRLLFTTQTVMMLCAFYLAFSTFFKFISVEQIVIVAFISGTAMALNAPAYQALVPRLLPREDLSNGIALNSAQFNMSRVLGPALGGFAMRLLGIAGNYFLNSLSFVAVLIALTRIDYHDEPKPKEEQARIIDDLRDGFRYVFGDPKMGPMVTVVTVMSLLVFPYISFLPLFARNILNIGEPGLGMLMASSGVGAFIAAAIIAQQRTVKNRGEIIMRAGLCYCVAIIVFALSKIVWLSMLTQFGAGLSMLFMVANVNTSLQHLSSDEMRGRVMAIYATAFLGLVPIGSLVAGALAHRIATPFVIAGMSALALVIFIIVYFAKPELRTPGEATVAS